MTAAGVPAGAISACQVDDSWSAKPASTTVGICGDEAKRCSLVTASARSRPPRTNSLTAGKVVQPMAISPLTTDCTAGPAPLKGICVISSPRLILSCSTDKCATVPEPAET